MIEPLIALVALSLMEIVLGIDNIVFISILTAKLPIARQSAARRLGLLLALGTRLLLLSCIFWIAQLTSPVLLLSDWLPTDALKTYFTQPTSSASHGSPQNAPPATGLQDSHSQSPPAQSAPLSAAGHQHGSEQFDQHAWEEFDGVSWRDLILISGGLFLLFNSVREIHSEVEGGEESRGTAKIPPSFSRVLLQIAVMDIVFSLDSVITAVGMANQLWVMITAVVLAVGVMILFANQVGNFVDQHPTIRMLALSFLLLIGVMLVAEGVGTPINKGYIYFAMAFSLVVESFNLRARKRHSPAALTP